eukprot:GAHX01000958.1.p1 GENE.GAHX01000958.1~~GAHX01000958.1.p1  ORF type:complete len:548 (+),score=120.05 GAHX01000958.1:51-1694(+)
MALPDTPRQNSSKQAIVHIRHGKTNNIGFVECMTSTTLAGLRTVIKNQLFPEHCSNIPKNYKFFRRQSPISPEQEEKFTIKKISTFISPTEYLVIIGPSKVLSPLNTYDSNKILKRKLIYESLWGRLEACKEKDHFDNLFAGSTVKTLYSDFSSDVESHKPFSFVANLFSIYSEPSNMNKPLWLDIQTSYSKLVRILGTAMNLHDLTIEDIITGDCKEKLEFFENYVFVVIKDPYFEELEVNKRKRSYSKSKKTRSIAIEKERSYVSNVSRLLKPLQVKNKSKKDEWVSNTQSKYLDKEEKLIFIIWSKQTVISIHSFQSVTVDHLYNKIRRRKKIIEDQLKTNWVVHGLLDSAVDIMLDQNNIVECEMEAIGGYVNQENIKQKFEIFEKLAELRKFTFEQKKGVWPKKNILTSIASSNVMNCLQDIPKPYFNDIHSHLDFIAAELNENSAVIDTLQNFHMGRISLELTEASNHSADIVEVLTVITTLSTPMTVFGSIMGMNVRVPWQVSENNHNVIPFWTSIGVMLTITILLWFWLKWLGVKLKRK